MKRRDTEALILKAALVVAGEVGLHSVTRNAIAKEAGLAGSVVQYHYRSLKSLTNTIVLKSIETKDLKVLAQAIGYCHPLAQQAPKKLRDAAMEYMAREYFPV